MPHIERSPRWYLIGGSIVLLTAVYGILTGAWTLSLVILLIAGMYTLLRNAPPPVGHISISPQGFTFNDAFTSWIDCESFWLLQGPGYIELHILKKRRWHAEVVIQIGPINPQSLRGLLGQLLTEHSDQRERLLDTIIRICKL